MEVIDANGNSYGSQNVVILDKYGKPKTTGGGGGAPSGPAGGDLTGTYPNPGVNWSAGSGTYNTLYYPLSTNPANYLTGITGLMITTALGYTPYSSSNPAGYITTAALSGYLTSATAAATYYPLSNPSSYITGITGVMVTTALGYTPYNATNPAGYITGITSGDVTSALGFTPYSNANPAGYITTAALSGYLTSATAASTYYPIPTGTTAQYLRGDGTLATFPSIPSVTPAALTKVDDTNVTLSLGGSPTNALLQAVSLTIGWTGTLADSRIASAATWNAKQNALGYTPVNKAGDTMLGTLTLNANPVNPLEAATKQYVDANTPVSAKLFNYYNFI